MPSSSPQRASARRALLEDIRADTRGWLRHGVAALGVSVLGLGIAGSVTMVGAAQHTTGDAAANTTAGTSSHATTKSASAAPTETGSTTSSASGAAGLSSAKLKSLADQRAEQLSKTDQQVSSASKDRAAKAREDALSAESDQASKQASLLANHASATAGGGTQVAPQPKIATVPEPPATTTATPLPAVGKTCLPVTTGYSVAARFGQLGPWARYHTGFDFSAPVGTPLHAPAAGVVINAGIGPASGWAGNYVAIRYPDGTQSLMAHMSTVSVQVGQTVAGCQLVGAIGMTGRTFGPHVHFEIYPAGITPGDVYRAVNPVPWLATHGLKP